jgi:hypothetical protein
MPSGPSLDSTPHYTNEKMLSLLCLHNVQTYEDKHHTQSMETTDKQRTKLQIKHNKDPAYRKGKPLKCKQMKKSIALSHVDNAPYEVE